MDSLFHALVVKAVSACCWAVCKIRSASGIYWGPSQSAHTQNQAQRASYQQSAGRARQEGDPPFTGEAHSSPADSKEVSADLQPLTDSSQKRNAVGAITRGSDLAIKVKNEI
ncbi:hypothetical protein NDU88_005696 [Pleurodeles waltl]|uniref:Uncharacterized protein n=1 Tax=Pleurodeles waltl TaxID=8319 RepID=A0AAV7QFP3_PLEWA|nr:hypothetical protein NDU88_005696 [Pleurodeles waltl]